MKILCDNKFCVYFENGMCILSSVSLDDLGLCRQTFIVDVEEEYLLLKRKKLLKKFEQLDC